jgi:hypothetical protein
MLILNRATDTILDRLISWSAAVEASSNQPILPCAILVIDICENDEDALLWNTTLSSLAETVDKHVCFLKYAEFWRARGKCVSTVEDLISCYYSSFTVSPMR